MDGNPGERQSSKQKGYDLCYEVLDPVHLLFYAQSLCMNYTIAMVLLVSCMSTTNHLLYFARYCARSTPKIANKTTQQRPLPGFMTISL